MDLSALQNSIKALEDSLDSWAFWLELATFLVVIGLILEYWHEVRDLLTERPFKWKQLMKFSGAILVIAGVAGELFVGYKASRVETNLRAANGKEIAELTKQAGNAKTSADKSADAADRATTSAQQANDQARIAQERAAEVGRQAAELRRKTLELAKSLEDSQNAELAERKTVAELENSLAPRRLGFQIGPGNKSSFDELKPFAGTQVIIEVLTDAEARRAAQEVGNVLGAAQWKITGTVSNPELYPGFFDGVTIWSQLSLPTPVFSEEQKSKMEAGERCRKAADALSAYLLAKNWKSMARAHMNPPGVTTKIPGVSHEIASNALLIVVGFKPNPFFDPDWVKQMEENISSL